MPPIVCYLDEKWFWTTSRCKMMKILPKAPFEKAEDAFVPSPKLRSRRHATKVIFLAIVGPPSDTCGFDGKIYIQRVSEVKQSVKTSHNKKISDEYEINHLLKDGHWINLLPEDDFGSVDVGDKDIVSFYNLEPEVAKSLHFSFNTHSKTGKSQKVERFREGKLLENRVYVDDEGNTHPLYLDQLTLFKEVKAGSLYHEDTSCDSSYIAAPLAKWP